MATLPDIAVNLPAEHLNALAEVIRTGLQRSTKLTPAERKNLSAWWDVEYDMIQEEIENNSGA